MFTINGSRFRYGEFINALIAFLAIAAAVFFFVVKPVNELMERFKTEPDPDERTRKCPECVSEIPASGAALRVLHGRGRSRSAG